MLAVVCVEVVEKVVLVGRRGKGLSRVFRRRERCGLCEILAGASGSAWAFAAI
jgi:hypothetical protein